MEARGGLRSSARLSGTAPAAPAAPPDTRDQEQRRAAAAARRARAERAAERAREVEDSPRVLRDKCRRLARALRDAKHLVVYTGAGISTAADIPDYRGPHGVWTRLQRGETVGRVEVSRAQPTFTHMALTALWARGALKFVVSQNCDGLHVRAGLPRRALAELHGDMFAERCAACRAVYLRAFDTTERTARHAHRTRRLCHTCGRELRDSIVHFGERGRAAWPLNWAGALRHAAAADVVLCLGSSLKVLRRYPRLWRMQRAPNARPALYIVNLQWTPKDSVAALKINARCDEVMAQVARRLRLRVPRYRPQRDPLLAHAEPLAPPEAHTTRRPLLSPPPAAPAAPEPASDCYSLSSPSASDSDDELPLRRLADRLRPVTSAASNADTVAARQGLTSFQVHMQSGEATILLRAEHAPTEPPPPEPPPAQRSTTDELRRFRFTRPPVSTPYGMSNGIMARTNGFNSALAPSYAEIIKVKSEEMKIKKEEPEAEEDEIDGGIYDSKLRRLLSLEPRLGGDLAGASGARRPDEPKEEKEEDKEGASSGEEAAGSLAAAIIRRAVLVCRASLYPGLHTILAPAAPPPPAPPPAAPQCAWCAERFAARRCLWYGPPRDTPPERRAWRRERGRRYLCACCGPAPAAPPAAAPPPAQPPAPDDGGWYGKGYRKGRRRRR
ncbi:uncharacterized protein Sirt7 [Epargyreus clarus]|uniref:uncharacterized protein Sirt7 n=1 Tax=Epargyreus clarus TaxID=520877 RepID=UPI003C2CF789